MIEALESGGGKMLVVRECETRELDGLGGELVGFLDP